MSPPAYPGSERVEQTTSSFAGGGGGIVTTYRTPDSLEQVVEFYAGALGAPEQQTDYTASWTQQHESASSRETLSVKASRSADGTSFTIATAFSPLDRHPTAEPAGGLSGRGWLLLLALLALLGAVGWVVLRAG